MLKLLLILFISISAQARELQVGDVILQPLRCYLCRMIEQHENSIYSHMGIVVATTKEVVVAEAWGVVRKISLAEFLQKGDQSRPHLVLRPLEAGHFLLEEALSPLLGAEYDHDFRWDNLGQDGREALYCSELVTKLLNPFFTQDIPTKIMDYTENAESWSRYFRGNVPQGLPGNSPGDFERSPLFKKIGTYVGGQWNWN